jgi:hypothetical protein
MLDVGLGRGKGKKSSVLAFEVFGILIIGTWLVTANLAAWLAAERGRDFIPWLILGLLTGPVALLAAGFADRVPRGRYKECPECQEAILQLPTRCPKCQADLLETVPD